MPSGIPKSGDLVVFEHDPVATVFDTVIDPNGSVVALTRGGQHFDVPMSMLSPYGTTVEADCFKTWQLALPLQHAAIDWHRSDEVKGAIDGT